jgi:hypothetical protein
MIIKVILTVAIIMAGQPPQMLEVEAESLAQCFEAAASFTSDEGLRKDMPNGGIIGASCAVVVGPTQGVTN